jgi:hypothetical protein
MSSLGLFIFDDPHPIGHHTQSFIKDYYQNEMMVSSEYMENRLPDCQEEVKRLKKLLREVIMRQNLAFPETEEDEQWFAEEMYMSEKKKYELLRILYEKLELGQHSNLLIAYVKKW